MAANPTPVARPNAPNDPGVVRPVHPSIHLVGAVDYRQECEEVVQNAPTRTVSTSRSVSRHQIQAGTILRRYIVFVILVFSTFCFAKKLSENGTASFFFACRLDLRYDQFDFAPSCRIFDFLISCIYFYVDVRL